MVRRRLFAASLIGFLTSGARAASAGALDDTTHRHLERALSCVNLSEEDLGWDKRPISDDFRLPCVNQALDHPLTLADRAVQAEEEFADDPVGAAQAVENWLGVTLGDGDHHAAGLSSASSERTRGANSTTALAPPKPAPAAPPTTVPIQPERFRGAPHDAARLLALLVNAYQEASRLREEAMAALSPEERKTLLDSGARLYTEESEEDWDMSAPLAAAKKVDLSRLVRAEQVLAEAANEARAKLAEGAVAGEARTTLAETAVAREARATLAEATVARETRAAPAEAAVARETRANLTGTALARERSVRAGPTHDHAAHEDATDARAARSNASHERTAHPDTSRWPTRTWKVDGVTVGLGGPGPDTHSETIVLDGGGDDVYTAGAVVLDLSGDDVYRGAGQGLFSVALILDLAGDDRYLGKNFAQGGAAFGASLLIDVAGDDLYEADQCSQGAAFFGVGMLFDLAGNDSYKGARFVQGFGGVRGLGALSDLTGNDTYYAGGKYTHAPLLPENYQSLSQGFGFGLRGASVSGGVGILADHAGNDVYSAEVFGQGASYWFSLGILVDSSGHDKYNLYQYGQGAGIHLSAGVLFDRAGNDAYSCNNGVAQGSGHDWGTGLLWDLAGDDCYQGSGMSQGGANANGIGMLIDRAGNDSYAGWNEKNQGDSFLARGTIGLGVLLDLAGKDRYTHGGKDGAIWTRGTVGVGLDDEDPPPSKQPASEKKP